MNSVWPNPGFLLSKIHKSTASHNTAWKADQRNVHHLLKYNGSKIPKQYSPFFPWLNAGRCLTCQSYTVPWPVLKQKKQSQPGPLGHSWVMSALAQPLWHSRLTITVNRKDRAALAVRDCDRLCFSLALILDAILKSHYQRSHLTTSINQSQQEGNEFGEGLIKECNFWYRMSHFRMVVGWRLKKKKNTREGKGLIWMMSQLPKISLH